MNRRTALSLAVAVAVIVGAVVFALIGESQPARVPSNVAESTIGVDQQRSDPFDIVFDIGTVRTYNIVISEASLARLNANPTAEQYVEAAVEIDGQRYEPVGIRYKGFFGVLRFCFQNGRQVCPKLSWKLKLNHYEPSLRYHGLKRLNFHSMNSDESQMREILSYQVFRDSGTAAPRSVYAELQLNGEPLGLFTLTEDIDDRFIADRFRDRGRGVLFKEIWPGNIDNLWVFQETLSDAVVRGPRDTSQLEAFAEALETAESEEVLYEALLDHLQDDQDIFNYLAADRLTDNWDGIVAWYCVPVCGNHNYFWYQDALSGGFTLIPWDVEHTWRSPSPIRTAYQMPDWDELDRTCRIRKVFFDIDARAPHCDPTMYALVTMGWERYIEASRELLRETISVELMHERVDALAEMIDEHIQADSKGPGYATWQQAVDRLHDEIDDRWQYIEAKIDAWDANAETSRREPSDG